MKIAVLLTCFNRIAKTERCLEKLFEQDLPENTFFKVFICDDNSSDGTGEMLGKNFPEVVVVKGDGKKFWNGGMRLAWESAIRSDRFDFYLWLNDDTFLEKDALKKILQDYQLLSSPAIFTAACKRPNSEEFSYGGENIKGFALPNGSPQRVSLINGNCSLIPREIVQKIGILSPKYTHGLGDFDYGLRAIEAGFSCYTTSEYLAQCELNFNPYWGDPQVPFKKRWELVHNVKGLAIYEYIYFQKRHFGQIKGIKTWIGTYLRVLFPRFYILLRNIIQPKTFSIREAPSVFAEKEI